MEKQGGAQRDSGPLTRPSVERPASVARQTLSVRGRGM
jgi:hypothetical protein